MKKGIKYETAGLIEDQYEPGSGGRVLKNLLRIKSKRKIDHVEAREQLRTIDEISKLFGEKHCFSVEDICAIHRIWLGQIYSWAGQYRQVNISKGGFQFASAQYIPALMKEFERDSLRKFTPCRNKEIEKIAEALAVVHTELILIHPFREGNGRVARLLSILMGWQAQLPTLDFGGIIEKKREEYFSAVRVGMSGDYVAMKKIFRDVIERTLKKNPKK